MTDLIILLNDITKQIIENNLPISNVSIGKTRSLYTWSTCGTIYKWYNKDTKKWYFGDKWSQKCNFSPNSAANCGGKYYIAKIFKKYEVLLLT